MAIVPSGACHAVALAKADAPALLREDLVEDACSGIIAGDLTVCEDRLITRGVQQIAAGKAG